MEEVIVQKLVMATPYLVSVALVLVAVVFWAMVKGGQKNRGK